MTSEGLCDLVRLARPWSILFFMSLGCGNTSLGTVSGNVTVQGITYTPIVRQGQPIRSGIVQFLCADGKTYSSMVEVDGTYSIPNVALGNVKIGVQFAFREDEAPGTRQALAFALRRFENPETSGLTYTVEQGRQTFDIDLNP